jgi:DNA repair exonuclease SbcCD nuclease subunit
MRIIKLPTEFVRAIFFTDIHLTDDPPGRRHAGYREEVMGKVDFVSALTQEHQAVGLCGGDWGHSKNPRSAGNTFSMINRVIKSLFGFWQGRCYGVHGNHDLYMDRVESIPHQPIGTLISSGAFCDISLEPHEPEQPGSVIFENADGTVRVQVDAFTYTSDDMLALNRVLNAAPRHEGVTYRVVLLHQYGDPGDAPSMYGSPTIGFNRMANSDYDLALWGHDHSRVEPMQVGNCMHVRLGSLSRASLAEDEVDRPINVAMFTFKPGKVSFKEIPIPVKPLEIAFTAADKPVEKVRDSDEVVSYFRQMDVAMDSIESTDIRVVLTQLATDEEGLTDKPVLDIALDCCTV